MICAGGHHSTGRSGMRASVRGRPSLRVMARRQRLRHGCACLEGRQRAMASSCRCTCAWARYSAGGARRGRTVQPACSLRAAGGTGQGNARLQWPGTSRLSAKLCGRRFQQPHREELMMRWPCSTAASTKPPPTCSRSAPPPRTDSGTKVKLPCPPVEPAILRTCRMTMEPSISPATNPPGDRLPCPQLRCTSSLLAAVLSRHR